MRGSEWITVVMMEMVLILLMVMMERPPPTPRRRGDGDGNDFPLLRSSTLAGSDPFEGGRGFATVMALINLEKIKAFVFWRDKGVLKRGGRNRARGANE
jgi:hypothetical protein